MHAQQLGQRSLAPGRVVAHVEPLQGRARAKRVAHDLDAVGHQVVVRDVELRERLVRAKSAPKRAQVTLQISEEIAAQVETDETERRGEHAREPHRIFVASADAVGRHVERR